MDEIELRVCALELLVIELMPWLDRQALDDAERSISNGLHGCCGDEKAVRQHAIEMIRDGRMRFGGQGGS